MSFFETLGKLYDSFGIGAQTVDAVSLSLQDAVNNVSSGNEYIYKTKNPLISRQLTTNKAFKRGSSFCSLSRLNLQNEDPIDFASVDNEQSRSSFCSLSRPYLQNEDPIDFASVDNEQSI